MYEGNIKIDTPDQEWTPDAVERLFIFCQFDRAMPYEKVVAAYDYLEKRGFVDFDELRALTPDDLAALLREAGLRFPKETAHYLSKNVNAFDGATLHKMSRDEIVEKCHGFGWKLASMFCNRCQGTQYAIIDVHIDRYLRDHGCVPKNRPGCTGLTYKEKEECFRKLAEDQEKTVDQLDWEIWDKNRIGNREKNGR